MIPRRQPRRIARELAILGLSQINANPKKLEQQQLKNLVLAAIRALTVEVQETLEQAAAEVKRGSDRLLNSETRTSTVEESKKMVQEGIKLTQTAINRLGTAMDLPEFVQLANQQDVRDYALDLIGTINRRQVEIDQTLTSALIDWQLNRLPNLDRDILRLAVAEILFLKIPKQVAINEAVELAKRYSDEEGHRFVNGVLRRVTNQLATQTSD